MFTYKTIGLPKTEIPCLRAASATSIDVVKGCSLQLIRLIFYMSPPAAKASIPKGFSIIVVLLSISAFGGLTTGEASLFGNLWSCPLDAIHIRQYSTKELTRWRMNFSPDAMADAEGLTSGQSKNLQAAGGGKGIANAASEW